MFASHSEFFVFFLGASLMQIAVKIFEGQKQAIGEARSLQNLEY